MFGARIARVRLQALVPFALLAMLSAAPGLADTHSPARGASTFSVLDVAGANAPLLTRAQMHWLVRIRTSQRFARIWSRLRFVNQAEGGVPLVVFDPSNEIGTIGPQIIGLSCYSFYNMYRGELQASFPDLGPCKPYTVEPSGADCTGQARFAYRIAEIGATCVPELSRPQLSLLHRIEHVMPGEVSEIRWSVDTRFAIWSQASRGRYRHDFGEYRIINADCTNFVKPDYLFLAERSCRFGRLPAIE